MDWKELYKKKTISIEDAAKLIEPGDKVVVGMIGGEPIGISNAIAARKAELRDVEFYAMGPMNSLDFMQPGMEEYMKLNSSIFLCKEGRTAYKEGRADYLPSHGSEVPRILTEYKYKSIPKGKVKVISDVSPMDKFGYFSLGTSPGYSLEPMRMENSVVILEVNENQPRILGDTFIHISEIDYLVENNHPIITLGSPESTKEDEAIAQYIANEIEDRSTLQLGIGSMPNVLGKLLSNKKDLGVHSEMMGDAFMELWEQGVATGKYKTIHPRKIVNCFALASQKCYDWLHENPAVEFYTQAYTNDQIVICQNYKPVAINQCLEIDLFGQVASESMGINQYSGTGGQVDFTAGVQRNPEGKAFICTKSTTKVKGKTVSKIKATFEPGQTITTLRTDVQYVVTEFGIVQLKGLSLRERAEALISIAHPDFRDELTEEAKKLNILR